MEAASHEGRKTKALMLMFLAASVAVGTAGCTSASRTDCPDVNRDGQCDNTGYSGGGVYYGGTVGGSGTSTAGNGGTGVSSGTGTGSDGSSSGIDGSRPNTSSGSGSFSSKGSSSSSHGGIGSSGSSVS